MAVNSSWMHLTQVAYIAAVWLISLHPAAYQPLPAVTRAVRTVWRGHTNHAAYSFASAPKHLALHLPQSRHIAWQLGHLAALVQAGVTSETEAVHNATRLLKLPPHTAVTPQQLQQLGSLLEAAESYKPSSIKSLLGLLSFVNFMWFTSIVGICITIGPVAYILLEPIFSMVLDVLRKFADSLSALMQAVARLLWSIVVLLRELAGLLQPFYPAMGYIACFHIVAAASSCEANSARFIALTGQGLAVVIATYETLAEAADATRITNRVTPQLLLDPTFRINSFAAAAMAPTAVAHQSQLAGFLAVAGLFSALGFAVIPFGCGWSVGWSNSHTMFSSELASAALLLALVSCRSVGVGPAWQEPFQLGVSVMGSNCLGLAGIIHCSKWCSRDGDMYAARNIGFLLLSAACIAATSLLGMAALRNTAVTYTTLWISEKVVEVTAGKGVWLTLFVVSLMGWLASLLLSAHPEWLLSLVQL